MPHFRTSHITASCLAARCMFALSIPAFASLALGCDDRTAEEKGHDYADEKLGFVEGAAEELSERGKGIGSSLGKGVGELVKGTGSAVKDVVHPTVTVTLSSPAKTMGFNVGQATEGADGSDNREVVIHLTSEKPYSGQLSLAAIQNDKTTAISVSTPLDLVPGKSSVIRFQFDTSVRLSKMERFELNLEAGKRLELDEKVSVQGIQLGQLSESRSEEGLEVSVYAIFEKPFRQGLSLRAFDSAGSEVGRSIPAAALHQTADSAGFISFRFDKRTPLEKITAYKILVDTNAKPAKP